MTDLALAAANLLERIGHLIRTEEQIGGLYPAQWAALRYLARANRFSRTPMALTHYLGSTRGTVSQTLIALEKKGLVTRTPSERDKRSVDVALTTAGKKIIKNDPLLNLADEIRTATNEKPETTQQVLEKILKQLLKENDGRAFGQCKNCRYFKNHVRQSAKEPNFCALLEVGLSEQDSEKICAEQVD